MPIDSAVRRTLLLLAAVLFAVLPRTASAAERTKALVVLSEGAASQAPVAALRTDLAADFTVGEGRALRASLGRWSKASLVGTLGGDRRDDLLNDVARAARAQGIDAVVLVEVRVARRERTAMVVLIDPHDALLPLEVEAKLGPKPNARADAARLHALLLTGIAALKESEDPAASASDPLLAEEPSLHPSSSPPASPSPARGDEKDAGVAEAPSVRRDLAHAIFVLEPHAAVGTRHFAYVDRISTGQRGYDLAAAPVVGIAGEVYPFATLGYPLLNAFGIVGEYGQAVALKSAPASGERVDTSWSHFDVALRGRLPLSDRASIGARAGYGVLDYSFGSAGALGPELPSVTYRYLKAGVDARVEVWKIALLAGLDYLAVQSASGVADRYPHATVGGIDAMAGIGAPFAGHFEARTGVRYQRFFYSMNPRVGEASVAGGATDEYGRWDTSLAFYY